MKIFSFFLLVMLFISCNPAKQQANKALELSKKGEYTYESVLFPLFEYREMFTPEPYIGSCIKEYGRDSFHHAWETAEQLIRIPNLIDSYEFIKMEMGTMDIKGVTEFGFTTNHDVESELANYYVTKLEGRIDSIRKIYIYTSEKNAKTALLKYIITIDGKKIRYDMKLVKLDGDWKIYYAFPEIHL